MVGFLLVVVVIYESVMLLLSDVKVIWLGNMNLEHDGVGVCGSR